MNGCEMGLNSSGILRQSANAAAERKPAMEEGHPLSITGFGLGRSAPIDSVWDDRPVRRDLLPVNETTRAYHSDPLLGPAEPIPALFPRQEV